MSNGLFEMEPRPMSAGDSVIVECMWGPEKATYVRARVSQGFLVCVVDLDDGTRVEMSPGRVRHV